VRVSAQVVQLVLLVGTLSEDQLVRGSADQPVRVLPELLAPVIGKLGNSKVEPMRVALQRRREIAALCPAEIAADPPALRFERVNEVPYSARMDGAT
jgi:hypothetical protein